MIVKFCNRTHNPFMAHTRIQLCSALFYKSTENDFIRDIEEGQIGRVFCPIEPVAYSGDEFGKMLGTSVAGKEAIRFSGRALKTTNQLPNAYIFCTSHLEQPTLSDAKSLGYDSFYVIKDPSLLSERIAQEIAKTIVGQARLFAFHGMVSYLDEKEVSYPHLPDFAQSHKILDPSLFLLKRRSSAENASKLYSADREYRFVFIPHDPQGRSIQLPAEKIFIESSVIMGALSCT